MFPIAEIIEGQLPPIASIILFGAIILVAGFLMSRVTQLLKLPNVTAYIIVGILIGPFCFNIIPISFVEQTQFVPDIALSFIAFSTGEFFKFSEMKRNGKNVIIITLAEALLASVLVFVFMFYILRLDFAFSIVLAALASATAPASTMMTIRQTGAKGDYVHTLLEVVALDDMVALVAYGVSISIANSVKSGQAIQAWDIIFPILENLAILGLGGVFGVFLWLFIRKLDKKDERLIITLGLLFGFCGICAIFDISPLLGCMSMGMIYRNVSGDKKLFKQINYFSPPFLLFFFVRSGIGFDLNALIHPQGDMGSVPLYVIGITYFIVRIAGKYGGASLGCAAVKKDSAVTKYLGLALIPQAGVAIGLAALGARSLGGSMGTCLNTVILASSVLYELIGPACAKLGLYLSHSYPRPGEEGYEEHQASLKVK